MKTHPIFDAKHQSCESRVLPDDYFLAGADVHALVERVDLSSLQVVCPTLGNRGIGYKFTDGGVFVLDLECKLCIFNA